MLRELNEKTGDGSAQPLLAARPSRTLFGGLSFNVLLAILAILLHSLVIAPLNIPFRSMTPTMLVGNCLFVAKWHYCYSRYSFPFAPDLFEGRIGSGRPDRGDGIVLRSPVEPDGGIGLIPEKISLAGRSSFSGRPTVRRVGSTYSAGSQPPAWSGSAADFDSGYFSVKSSVFASGAAPLALAPPPR